MIEFKSKKLVEKRDRYNNVLGMFTQRLKINSIKRVGDEMTPEGFYYYINNEGEQIVDAPIENTTFTREQVTQAEAQLPAFSNNHVFDCMDDRIIQFSFIKWQIENGSSFGLLAEDWEVDNEGYNERMKKGK